MSSYLGNVNLEFYIHISDFLKKHRIYKIDAYFDSWNGQIIIKNLDNEQ